MTHHWSSARSAHRLSCDESVSYLSVSGVSLSQSLSCPMLHLYVSRIPPCMAVPSTVRLLPVSGLACLHLHDVFFWLVFPLPVLVPVFPLPSLVPIWLISAPLSVRPPFGLVRVCPSPFPLTVSPPPTPLQCFRFLLALHVVDPTRWVTQ